MYTVIYFNVSSPVELSTWLNRCYRENGWKLIAVDNGYYIFEVQNDVIVDDKSA